MKLMLFLMGLDDCYQPVRNALLTRDPLHEVKDAYTTVSREESHRRIPETSSATELKMSATSFAAKSVNKSRRVYNNNNNCTRGSNNNNMNRGPNPNLVCKNYGMIGQTIKRCYEIIRYSHCFKKVSNPIKQNGYNKQNFNANVDLKNNDKQSSAIVPSPGFTSEQMQELLSLINDNTTGRVHAILAGANQHLTVFIVGMFDVIDITSLKITVSHPNGTLATISKMYVGFDEDKCYIQDSKREKVLGTGSESGGLYYFDMDKVNNVGKSNMVMCFNVSKLLWHNRLGHPFDQVLSVLQSDLNITKNCFVPICEVCHRARQTRDPFPLSDHKSKGLEFTSEVDHLKFFDRPEPQSSNDEGKAPSIVDGSDLSSEFDTANTTHNLYQEEGGIATKLDDNSISKDSRHSVSSPSSVRYSIEKFVCYSKLSESNMCFATSLNKFVEPSYYEDVMCDTNWIDDMNNEIKALNRNNTWTVCDLPSDRKAIRWWNAKLTTALTKHGFKQSKFNYSLYVKQSGESFVAQLVYVDDIVITGNNEKEIDDFKKFLSLKFLIKKLGKLKYFLEIEDLENDKGLCMTQMKYCLELLHKYGLLAARPIDIPLPENIVLNHIESNNDNPLQSHMKAALRVLRYLKGSPVMGIQFDRVSDLKLRVFLMLIGQSVQRPRSRLLAWLLLLVSKSSFHEKSKHFEIDVHLLREKVSIGVIRTVKIHTDLQVADIFTKCLGVVQHELFCKKLDIKSKSSQTKCEASVLSKDQSYTKRRKCLAQYDKSTKSKG
ncbi:ribonuclease H-like domain-containing protein [Tanacetum coccineum]